MFGTYVNTGFNCAIVCLYVRGSLVDMKMLWEEFAILNFSFGGPWYVRGDFIEILAQTEQSRFLNNVGARYFQKFLSTCDLLPLQGHQHTWFKGYSMSYIDRCYVQFYST